MNLEHSEHQYKYNTSAEGEDSMTSEDKHFIDKADNEEKKFERMHNNPAVGRGIERTTIEHAELISNGEKFARTLFYIEDKIPDEYGETGEELKMIFNGPGEWEKFLEEFPQLLAVFYSAPEGWMKSEERKKFLAYVLKVDRAIRNDETIH